MEIDRDERTQAVNLLRAAFSTLYTDPIERGKDSLPDYENVRSAFYVLTRMVLAKLWENHGLIEPYYYHEDTLDELDHLVTKALSEFYGLNDNLNDALTSEPHPYSSYHPDNCSLEKAFRQLSNLKLEAFDFDLLGSLYESYIDPGSRKDRGQYYTPREVVSYIWNRVGLKETQDFFHDRINLRYPKLIFDPAAGSGCFLMEAARRLTSHDEGNHHSLEELLEIRNAFSSLQGSEIQLFPSYIARINILIQLTPVIKELKDIGYRPQPDLSLFIMNHDSLGSHNQRLKYDFVCSNPPFLGEKGNKDLFRSTLQRYPYWKRYYQGKMDYSYWFIILGLSKLKVGGKLGFITTAYWPTADGASKLRKFILDHAIIRELVDLGNLSVFGTAPGQHNMIMILERSDERRTRTANPIKIAQVKKAKEDLKLTLDHLEKHIDKDSYSDDYIHVFNSPISQGDLNNSAWHLFQSAVAEPTLKKIAAKSIPLGQLCRISQGIISGADKVTNRNIKQLSNNLIRKYRIEVGDGVFVLTSKELLSLNLNRWEMTFVKPFCKNSDIGRYHLNRNDHQFLIYVTKETDIDQLPAIKSHLAKYRPILENRRECREGKLPWFSLQWPRNRDIFEGKKIITPNRAVKNNFAYSRSGLYAMSDVFFITDMAQQEDLQYVLAILNSSLMEFWFIQTQKAKGRMREYVGRPLSGIPICMIDFDKRSEKDVHDKLVLFSKEMMNTPSEASFRIQQEIDKMVLDLYALDSTDILL